MPIYFFDSRDGDTWVRDESGIEVAGLSEARDQATAGLADMAKDSSPNAIHRDMAIEVRDVKLARCLSEHPFGSTSSFCEAPIPFVAENEGWVDGEATDW